LFTIKTDPLSMLERGATVARRRGGRIIATAAAIPAITQTTRIFCMHRIRSGATLLPLLLGATMATQAAPGTDTVVTDTLATDIGTSLETISVEGRRANLLGAAISASQGEISQQEIALHPLLRTGEVLELVPGMVVTQHSGTGKANQYFLRGFNLDHGTDFATSVDGMPINMRTHGHGQGYTDLNFIIPETIDRIRYQKGAYYADVGDFSGAGAARMQTANRRERGLLELTAGADDYYRSLLLDSVEAAGGNWFYALEATRYQGPWSDISEDMDKRNLLLKHSRTLAGGQLSLAFMAYDNQWNSADQIPARAVNSGLIDAVGSLDDSVGGTTSRYSLSGQWQRDDLQMAAYAQRYELDLWSNFTYYLDDPVNGDQFEQVDQRWIYGGDISRTLTGTLAGLAMSNRLGAELRYDAIDDVGLYRTRMRERLGSIRRDAVDELSGGLFWENQLTISDRLRSILGLRYDYYDFDVDGRLADNINGVDLRANSGSASDDQVSLKGSLIYTLTDEWETYISAGQGFHSNDARGTTTRIDPGDGSNINPVDPLAQSLGYEIGLRGFWNERLNTAIALWRLQLDSELLFVGDAGTTEASRESRRQGIELTAYYRLNALWTLDLEYAWSDAEFTDRAPEGDHIPGAIQQVVQAGISATLPGGWFGSLGVRHFGERPLREDNSLQSDPSTLVNLRVGRELGDWSIKADLLNLLDSDDHDIDYYYTSQLAGEAVPVDDYHYHVLEPRTLRVAVGYHF
jgi:outer membrane cobalamin receptor